MISLREAVRQTYLVSYDEDVRPLWRQLRRDGFDPYLSLCDYSAEQKAFSRTVRCLMNHRSVWDACRRQPGLTLVVEADFVPVQGFGGLPLPFDPAQAQTSFGYLYACGPSLYEVMPEGALRGDAGSTVAYVLSSPVAELLHRFAEEELLSHPPHDYSLWDTCLSSYLKRHGVRTFLPFRSYGEHGGIGNPEHRGRAKFSTHRADVLSGSLAFQPSYARGSLLRFFGVRTLATLKGFARLCLGRYLHLRTWRRSSQKLRILICAFSRHLPGLSHPRSRSSR